MAVLQETEHSGPLPVEHLSVCLTLSLNSPLVLVWLMCMFEASLSQTQITQHLLGGSSMSSDALGCSKMGCRAKFSSPVSLIQLHQHQWGCANIPEQRIWPVVSFMLSTQGKTVCPLPGCLWTWKGLHAFQDNEVGLFFTSQAISL